jgi:hypothetical protein
LIQVGVMVWTTPARHLASMKGRAKMVVVRATV